MRAGVQHDLLGLRVSGFGDFMTFSALRTLRGVRGVLGLIIIRIGVWAFCGVIAIYKDLQIFYRVDTTCKSLRAIKCHIPGFTTLYIVKG